MLLKTMLEDIRKHHKTVKKKELIDLLNRASEEFAEETECIEGTFTVTTVAGTRYYGLSASLTNEAEHDIITIKRIDLENQPIPKLVGWPDIIDTDA